MVNENSEWILQEIENHTEVIDVTGKQGKHFNLKHVIFKMI